MSSLNPTSQRFPFNIAGKVHPEVENAIRWAFNGLTNHEQAFREVQSNIDSLNTTVSNTSSSSGSGSGSSVTTQQATTIANTQASAIIAQTFGTVNPQTSTAYTAQTSDYAGLVTFNNAAAVAVTLNSTVSPQWFTAMENLGTGTVTVTPDSGLINGLASIPLVTGAGTLIYRNPDGTNWSALVIPAPSGGGGVTSLQGETGALTLTSSGGTVTFTTPTSTTINLEAPTASGLPVNNPTFTGTLSGPTAVITEITADHYVGAGSAPSVVGLPLAGTGASFVMDTNATDVAGLIAMTAGAPNSGVGTIATVTYANPYPAGSFVVMTAFTSGTPIPALAQASSVGFDIVFGVTISSGTSVAISFIVSGY